MSRLWKDDNYAGEIRRPARRPKRRVNTFGTNAWQHRAQRSSSLLPRSRFFFSLDVQCLVCAKACDLILGIHVESWRDFGHRARGVIVQDSTPLIEMVAVGACAGMLGPGNRTTLRYDFGNGAYPTRRRKVAWVGL